MAETDDHILELIRSAETRDAGFRLLLQKYKVRLYWQVRKLVLIHEDADDVLQNVFIKIHRHISTFSGESKLHTWMYRIAYNESLNHIRNRKRMKRLDNEEFNQHQLDRLRGDEYFDGDKAALKLQENLCKLPYRQREVFNYRYYDDLKFREIAEILELSEGAVKANYHHAKEKLKQWLISR